MGATPTFDYWAFVSYSRADRRWGRWAHRKLETYRIPRKLVGTTVDKGTIPARTAPIFRDEEELATATSLPAALSAALATSRYLVVVCSPRGAQSKWVNEEILTFRRLGRDDSILYVLADGEPCVSEGPEPAPNEAIPTAGRYREGPDGLEPLPDPLAADIRGGRAARHEARLRLISTMIGVDFDDLRRREERRRRRRLLALAATTAAVVVAIASLAVAAVLARNEAVYNAAQATSRQLAAQAAADLSADPSRSLLLDVEALREQPTVEAEAALLDSLNGLPGLARILQPPLDRIDSRVGASVLASAARGVDITSSGDRVAVGQGDGTVSVWDLDTGAKVADSAAVHFGPINTVAYSPDDALLATGGTDGSIQLWRADTLAAIGTGVIAHDGPIFGLDFALDGAVVASTGGNELRLWDLDLAPLGETLVINGDQIVSFAVDGTGRLALAGTTDGVVTVWDLDRQAPIVAGPILAGTPVFGAALTADGELAAVGVGDDVAFFEARTGESAGASVRLSAAGALGLAFSDDGRMLAAGTGDGHVVLVDVAERTEMPGGAPAHGFNVWSVAFEPDSHRAVSAGEDGSVAQWDFDRPSQTGTHLRAGGSPVWSVAASATRAVTGDATGTLTFWDAAAATEVGSVPDAASGTIAAVALSPDGQMAATGTRSGEVSLWDVPTRSRLAGPATAGSGSLQALAFSPDAAMLAGGGGDLAAGGGWIVSWAIGSGGLDATELRELPNPVFSVAFSPDGELLAAGGGDMTSLADGWLTIVDGATGQAVATELTANDRTVLTVAFGPDGERLYTGGGDGSVWAWDAATFEPLGAPVRGHTSPVSGLVASADGAHLYTAAGDGAVRVWDAVRLEPLGDLSSGLQGIISSIGIDPATGKLYAGALEGSIVRYDTTPAAWADRACELANRTLTANEWARHFADGRRHEPACG